jgi:Trypsin.
LSLFCIGEYDRNKPENEEQHFGVESVTIHPQFNSLKNLNHDIALLKLDGTARMTDYINTVRNRDFIPIPKIE